MLTHHLRAALATCMWIWIIWANTAKQLLIQKKLLVEKYRINISNVEGQVSQQINLTTEEGLISE